MSLRSWRSRSSSDPFRDIGVWAILVACLTIVGAIWLTAEHLDYDDFSPAILLIGYSPALAAIATVGLLRGPGCVRALLSQFRRWRAGIGWYAIAALAPLAVMLLATGLLVLQGGPPPAHWIALPALAVVPSLLGPIVAGSVGEELGWRGFAQPRLEIRLDALWAAVLVGIAWSLWHVWPLLTPSGFHTATAADVLETFARLVSTAVIYAWLYNSTGKSLPVVMVAHAGHNVAIDVMTPSVVGSATGSLIVALFYVAAAGVVLAMTDPRTLTRAG
jgi:membrane protease YdiL (CAAX protease family)